jgi:hypothetical protein
MNDRYRRDRVVRFSAAKDCFPPNSAERDTRLGMSASGELPRAPFAPKV